MITARRKQRFVGGPADGRELKVDVMADVVDFPVLQAGEGGCFRYTRRRVRRVADGVVVDIFAPAGRDVDLGRLKKAGLR